MTTPVTSSAQPVKILVLYDSLTGNVEQMAKFVAEGASEIQGVEVRIRKGCNSHISLVWLSDLRVIRVHACGAIT